MKPIRTDADHDAAIRRMEEMVESTVGDSSESVRDEFEVLVALIEHYEAKTVKINPPDPVEAIRFRMEQQGRLTADINQWAAYTRKLLGGAS